MSTTAAGKSKQTGVGLGVGVSFVKKGGSNPPQKKKKNEKKKKKKNRAGDWEGRQRFGLRRFVSLKGVGWWWEVQEER